MTPTEPLFEHDPYLTQFRAEVRAVSPAGIVLDRSAFRPAGRLHPHDTGQIEDAVVHGTHWAAGGHIVHAVDAASALRQGDQVCARLDWPRRHTVMRLETVVQLLAAGVTALHESLRVRNAEVSAAGARCLIVTNDGTGRRPEQLELVALTEWIETAVRDDLEIVRLDDGTAAGRSFWYVDGLGGRPARGLFVQSTSEVGRFRLEDLGTARGLVTCRLTVEPMSESVKEPVEERR